MGLDRFSMSLPQVPKIKELISKIENLTNVPVTILNTGKPYNSIVDLTGGSVDWDESWFMRKL